MRKIKQWAVRNKKQLWIGFGAFVFGWFIWPTPYIYTRSSGMLYRTNRFTGTVEGSGGSGWGRASSVSPDYGEDRWEREAKAEERKWAREDKRFE